MSPQLVLPNLGGNGHVSTLCACRISTTWMTLRFVPTGDVAGATSGSAWATAMAVEKCCTRKYRADIWDDSGMQMLRFNKQRGSLSGNFSALKTLVFFAYNWRGSLKHLWNATGGHSFIFLINFFYPSNLLSVGCMVTPLAFFSKQIPLFFTFPETEISNSVHPASLLIVNA